jgi:serine/threonine protein kinase
MLSGLPVPDFSFEEDDDPYVFFVAISNSHCLAAAEARDLFSLSGLVIDDRAIRWTGNSVVYSARRDGLSFAVKVTAHCRRLDHEFANRQLLPPDSHYLVAAFALHELSSKVALQMELCPQGDIAGVKFDESDVWKLAHNIGSALSELHDRGWIHLDVSPGNILRSGPFFKLADFGTMLKIGKFTEGCEGAGPYVSPEALAYPRAEVSEQTDMFSLGVVLLEAVTGRVAPRGGTDAYTRIRRGEIRLGEAGWECRCSAELKVLVNAMLASDPSCRPTAKEVVALAAPRSGI